MSTRTEAPQFFLDECIDTESVVAAMRGAGIGVVRHRERFDRGCEDATWLAEVGRNGWIVVTKDDRIRYNEIERQALVQARVAAFIVRAKKLTGAQLAAAIRLALPAMCRMAQAEPRPFIASVNAKASVSLIVSADQVEREASGRP